MKRNMKEIFGAIAMFVIAALFLICTCSGCAAPGEVQVAQKYQQQVFTAYANNNTLICKTWRNLFERYYKEALDVGLEKDIASLKEEAQDGKVAVADIEAGIRELIAQRDSEWEAMQAILAKMELANSTNIAEFNKAMEITSKLNAWMNTGVDPSVIENMTDSVLAITNTIITGESK